MEVRGGPGWGRNNVKKKDKAGTPTEKKKSPKAKYYFKLLIVGTSSCGKSTLAKQMKILHCHDNFTEEERSNYRKILIFNMCTAMKQLIAKAQEFNFDIENESLAQNVSQLDPFEKPLTIENINDIKKLWEETGNNALLG